MAIAISRKNIYCPKCKYEGKTKIKGATGGEWGLFLLSVITAGFIPVFWIVAGIMLLWLIFKPARHTCPECNFENTASKKMADQSLTDSEEKLDANSKKCPACAETIKAEAKKCRYCGEMLSDVAP